MTGRKGGGAGWAGRKNIPNRIGIPTAFVLVLAFQPILPLPAPPPLALRPSSPYLPVA